MTALPKTGGPVTERADILDALRGFALLGILVSHVPDLSGYTFMEAAARLSVDEGRLGAWLAPLLEFVIRGKFYSLFALLFGIGFAIQIDSATRAGAPFRRRFMRRLAVLSVIGLCHAFVWYGDILKDYALIGLLLMLTATWSLRATTAAFVAVILLCVAWPFVMATAVPLLMDGGGSADGGFTALTASFASQDIGAIFAANAGLVAIKAMQMVYEGKAVAILAMFLLGSMLGKAAVYRNLDDHGQLFRRVLIVCAPLGIAGNAVLVPLAAATPAFPPTEIWVMERALFAIAVPAMALAYAAAFALLWQSHAATLRVFAPAGRMALTTYVSQTLILIGIFYGPGLGLYGQVGLVPGLGLALAIFAVQTAVAAAWFRIFRFGPLEWAWRCLTYGERIPMKKARPGLLPVQA